MPTGLSSTPTVPTQVREPFHRAYPPACVSAPECQQARAPACAVLLAGPVQNNFVAPAQHALNAFALDVQ